MGQSPRYRRADRICLVVSFAVALTLTVASIVTSGAPSATAATDRPNTFYYGTDSFGPVATGRGYPYQEPTTGGMYGAYGAEIGTWTNWTGCTSGDALNLSDLYRTNVNEKDTLIPGVSFYWFAAGPGADPHYNRTYAEAYLWGETQADRVRLAYTYLERQGIRTLTHYAPLMFMDIESQPFAGYANGWNEIVNRCGRITRKAVIPTRVDRATFNGFVDYLSKHTSFHPGVYSIPSFWTETFGTGLDSYIPNTDEWTPVTSTRGPNPHPYGFNQAYEHTVWFGGVLQAHRLAWQWTQNGGDYDQWESSRLPRR